MIKWVVNFLHISNIRASTVAPNVRVLTKKGWGTVVGGNVIVDLDESPVPNQPNQKQWTFNLDKGFLV